MMIGYARVSTDKQNFDLLRDALKDAGCGPRAAEKVERPRLRPHMGYAG